MLNRSTNGSASFLTMIKRLATVVVFVLLLVLATYGINDITKHHNRLQLNNIQLKDTESKLIILQNEYDSNLKILQTTKGDSEQNKKALQDATQRLQDLEKQKQDLESQLQAKRAKQAADKVYAAQTAQQPATPVYTASAVVSGCGDNAYANYIYMHESGCNPSAVNSIGCRGIGQACPGSKLPCGADYACQNAWFTNYANRYGGWAGAYAFWLAHSWW